MWFFYMIILNNDNKICLFEQIFLIKLNLFEGFVSGYLVVILQMEVVIIMVRYIFRDSDGLMVVYMNVFVIMLVVENIVVIISKIILKCFLIRLMFFFM